MPWKRKSQTSEDDDDDSAGLSSVKLHFPSCSLLGEVASCFFDFRTFLSSHFFFVSLVVRRSEAGRVRRSDVGHVGAMVAMVMPRPTWLPVSVHGSG